MQEVWKWNLNHPAHRRLIGMDLGCVAILNDESGTMESNSGSIAVAGERAFLRLTMSETPSNDTPRDQPFYATVPNRTMLPGLMTVELIDKVVSFSECATTTTIVHRSPAPKVHLWIKSVECTM